MVGNSGEECFLELGQDYAPDSLAELIMMKGYNEIETKKLGVGCFFITFADIQSKNDMDRNSLEIDIVKVRDAEIDDLILPRITWISILGLPICAYSDEVLSMVVSKWGRLVSKGTKFLKENQFINPRICNSTNLMDVIQGHTWVGIYNKKFRVEIKEEQNVILLSEKDVLVTRKDEVMKTSKDNNLQTRELFLSSCFQ